MASILLPLFSSFINLTLTKPNQTKPITEFRNREQQKQKMSSVVELEASEENHEESNNERLDHNLVSMDPTVSSSLSVLSPDTFLKAAIALKNQVRTFHKNRFF